MFLFDPYQKYIQSNNETILDQGTPIKTSLVANIRAAYYIINNYFFISQAKNLYNKGETWNFDLDGIILADFGSTRRSVDLLRWTQ